jgi:uncharacterized phage-associated protein
MTPRAVANSILDAAQRKGLRLTLMQLIKLVYLAHGWALALLGRPLIKHSVQAWQYGPVIPNVYKSFSGFGSSPISARAVDKQTGTIYATTLDEDEQEIIDSVVDSYGRMHAFQLSEMMHKPGTPWSVTFEASGAYSEVPQSLIKHHFEELARHRKVALRAG